MFPVMFSLLLWLSGLATTSVAYRAVKQNPAGDQVFELDDKRYLATTQQPKLTTFGYFSHCSSDSAFPLTVINSDTNVVTRDLLIKAVADYSAEDDVFSNGFLDAVVLTSSADATRVEAQALAYLHSIGTKRLFVDDTYDCQKEYGNTTLERLSLNRTLPPGPYLATMDYTSLSISTVYRLFPDVYRTFMNGIYRYDSGEHKEVGLVEAETNHPLIPVPSRIYSWNDGRPLAGERVGVKDIYEVEGLKATWGSLSHWKLINASSSTGPALSSLLDQGIVIVGKQKTAQFASPGDPWQFQDFQHPFNPRGDGWLTCSASSAGGGCSIAAYEWLDYALGTDTGTSMRRPAAVAGVYSNRPSQGLMALDEVMPISYACDSAGVFSRDPRKWAKFSKHYYQVALAQNESMTGLPALEVPDNNAFPTKIIYPVDLLPLNNPAAEKVLQTFIDNLTAAFNMKVRMLNVTHAVDTLVENMTDVTAALFVLWSYDQNEYIAKPLVSEWEARYGGYPPLDEPNRSNMRATASGYTAEEHSAALTLRRKAAAAFYEKILPSSNGSCSESILIHDIGTGGIPSFREYLLNDQPGSTFPLAPGAFNSGAICPFFGCVDFTIPIGQVPYLSNVTFQEEMMPVTINIVAKRGCDKVLWNFIEAVADKGILKSVKTGRTAF